MVKFTIDGLDDLLNDIKQLKEFPIDDMNRACKKGADVIKRVTNANAPSGSDPIKKGRSHALRGSFVSLKGKPRKSQRSSVAFYDVRVDPKLKFSEPIKNKGKFGGTRDHAFYPSAVEFGHKSGDRYVWKGNKESKRKGKSGNFVRGKFYMTKTAKAQEEVVLTVMVKELSKSVDKILGKG